MAEIKRIGDVIYDWLDQNTGEVVTYIKATHLPDGTPITINDCGVLYKELVTDGVTEYFRRVISDGVIKVGWYGIVGDGTDESAKVQALFNALQGAVHVQFDERTYRFFNVTIPRKIKKLTLDFKTSVLALPLRNNTTTPAFWERYKNTAGNLNFHFRFDNIRQALVTGEFTFDGEARLGNTFNQTGYAGQGLAGLFKVDCGDVNETGVQPSYTKAVQTPWLITPDGFSVTNGAFANNANIKFTRDPYKHYRVKFYMNITAGKIGYSDKYIVSALKSVSGEYFHDILATNDGPPATQQFNWFTDAASSGSVLILGVYELYKEHQDTYFKTKGNFTIKDHGFSNVFLNSGGTVLPSYRNVEIDDWFFMDTPIGGTHCTGWFKYLQMKNYKLYDPFGKTWKEFDDEGARGLQVTAANSGNVNTYPEVIRILDFSSDYGPMPMVHGGKDIKYDNISVNKFGRFIGGDGLERDLGANDGTVHALPLPPGGDAFKFDLPWYSPETTIEITNFKCRNTSQYVESNSVVWKNLWLQAGIKNGLIRNCRFDSTVNAGGRGDYDDKAQSWSYGATIENCEFTEMGVLNPVTHGVRILNCKFTRILPQKAANVDFMYPNFTDTKIGAYLAGTHPIKDPAVYGEGDTRNDPTQFIGCTFTARNFWPVHRDSKTEFIDCQFLEGTKMPLSGSTNNGYNFSVLLRNSKRLTVYTYDTPDATKKAGNFARFVDSEIILEGYTGAANLTDPASAIRKIFDTVTVSWDNLKIYDAAGILLHDLKGFEWLTEPVSTSAYGIEGAYFETTAKRYDYKGGAWVIHEKQGKAQATTGTVVLFDKGRNYGETAALTAFTLDLTGGVRENVATVFATGFSARPTALNAAYIKIASEPASYDSTKELMIMMRFISASKVIATITQY